MVQVFLSWKICSVWDKGYRVQEMDFGALGISQTLRSHSQCGGSWPMTGFAKMSRKSWYAFRMSSSEVFSLGSSKADAGGVGCFASNMRAFSCSFNILAAAFWATRTSSRGKVVEVLGLLSSSFSTKAFSKREN